MFRKTLALALLSILFFLFVAPLAFAQAPALATVADTNTRDVASITVHL